MQSGPLVIRRQVTKEDLSALQEKLSPYVVVRVRARIGESPFKGHQGQLEAFIGVDASDAELNQHAEQLQKPVTLEDAIFGTFTLDRRVDWFTAEVVWDGKPILLNLSESTEVRETLRMAHLLWERQDEWNRRIRDFAVQKLLSLKNDNWLDEDDAELTPDEFKDRMTLDSITMNADGSFDFWHNDGDLFWGHSIQIGGNLSEGPKYADIPG